MRSVQGGIRPDGDGFLMGGELTLKGVTLPVPLTLEINGFSAASVGSHLAPGKQHTPVRHTIRW